VSNKVNRFRTFWVFISCHLFTLFLTFVSCQLTPSRPLYWWYNHCQRPQCQVSAAFAASHADYTLRGKAKAKFYVLERKGIMENVTIPTDCICSMPIVVTSPNRSRLPRQLSRHTKSRAYILIIK